MNGRGRDFAKDDSLVIVVRQVDDHFCSFWKKYLVLP